MGTPIDPNTPALPSQPISISGSTQRFAQGVTAAAKVREAHAGTPFVDHEQETSLFWFYVGALAAGEHGCTEQEDFEPFILGAATRAPESEED